MHRQSRNAQRVERRVARINGFGVFDRVHKKSET